MLALLSLFACSDPWDGRIVPCEGEAPARCEVGRLDVDGVVRTFLVTRPEGWRCEDGPWRLVLAFHGSGMNGAALRAEVPFDAGRDAVVVYPDGLEGRSPRGATGWDQGEDSADLPFFDALVDSLLATGCYDPADVHVFGHSRGGRFTNTLACTRAGSAASFAEASAGRPASWACAGSPPFLVAHGVDDDEIPFSAGEAMLAHWRERNGCAADAPEAAPGTCTGSEGCDVVFCPFEGEGYRQHYPPAWVVDEIWAFFDAH